MAAISLFMLKQGSCNAFNLDRKDAIFRENYKKGFDSHLPHLDAVEDCFRQCNDDGLEEIKVKKYYPRLPIAIVADGLYPWDGFFETCQR